MRFIKWRNLLTWHILRRSEGQTVCGLGLVKQSKVERHEGMAPPADGRLCRLCDRLKAVKQQIAIPMPGEVRR